MREAQQKNARIYLVSNWDRGSTVRADSHRRGTGRPPASDCCRYLVARRRSDCALCCRLGPSVETIPGVNRQISRALGNADSRCSRSTRLARATEESTLALKTGPLLFPGVAHRPHDGWRLWPRGCPLGRIEHRTVHRTAAEERAKPSGSVLPACRRDTVDPHQKTMMVQSFVAAFANAARVSDVPEEAI